MVVVSGDVTISAGLAPGVWSWIFIELFGSSPSHSTLEISIDFWSIPFLLKIAATGGPENDGARLFFSFWVIA